MIHYRKTGSLGCYVISIFFLYMIVIKFYWHHWADMSNGNEIGVFSVLGLLMYAGFTIPLWFIGRMLNNRKIGNKLYWIGFVLFTLTVLLTPSSA